MDATMTTDELELAALLADAAELDPAWLAAAARDDETAGWDWEWNRFILTVIDWDTHDVTVVQSWPLYGCERPYVAPAIPADRDALERAAARAALEARGR